MDYCERRAKEHNFVQITEPPVYVAYSLTKPEHQMARQAVRVYCTKCSKVVDLGVAKV